MALVADITVPKQRGRPFTPGRSGNPRGRPKGSGSSAQLRMAISKEAPDIIAAVARRARSGDTSAARLLLDKVLPSVKAQADAIELAGLDVGGVATRAESLLSAVAKGQLCPELAPRLISALVDVARLTEVEELEARLVAIEEKLDEQENE